MVHSSQNALPRGPLIVLGISWLLLLGALLFPFFPRISLLTSFATAVVFVAESGSRWGFPVFATLVVLLLVTRPSLTMKRRFGESLVLGLSFGLLFGAGDYLNEHLIKPIMGVPRPFVEQLFEEGSLGASAEVFYETNNFSERSDYLKEVLDNPYFTGVSLSDPVRNHWIKTVGYSLPSGHTLGAFALLTFALISTKVVTTPVRYGLACLLIPWAIAVSYSRVVLRVHWPYDIISSGMGGILIGLAFYSVMYRVLWMGKPVVERAETVEEN
jgi:phosphatidylglycerophosphatase B